MARRRESRRADAVRLQGRQLGYVATPCCQYNPGDLCPFLPGREDGYYIFTMSVCPAGVAAVATRALLPAATPFGFHGFADGGCDDIGAQCTPFEPESCPANVTGLAVSRSFATGMCRKKGKHVHCRSLGQR
jgi:hypothetical protein